MVKPYEELHQYHYISPTLLIQEDSSTLRLVSILHLLEIFHRFRSQKVQLHVQGRSLYQGELHAFG